MIKNFTQLCIKRFIIPVLIAAGHLTVLAQSGIYGGGPIYKNRSYAINELRNSGYTYVVVWTIHIDASGNFNFNAEFPLVQNGTYVGGSSYPNFADDMARLKSAPTTINRLEFCLSGWGSSTFANIKNLIASQGTGSSSILYRNFQALRNTFPMVDAIGFDDESTYDVSSATALAVMLGNLGFKVSLVPYTNSGFWTSVATSTNNQRAGTIDRIDLQCYSGGKSNSPCNWNFGTIPVYAGLWDAEKSTSQVQSQLNTWKSSCSARIKGGFMWLYDDIDNSAQTAAYATAIRNVFGGGTLSTAAATFYRDCNYGGLGISLPAGDYNLTRLRSFGIRNDDISSVTVNSGYSTRLYVDDNFGGNSLALTASNDCLVDEGWNDLASSLIIRAGTGARTAEEAGRQTSFSSAPLVKGFILYPNPANSELILAADENLTGVFMQVFDMTGRSVMSFRNTINRLDLSRLRPGVYTLVFNRNGSKVTRQFIKQ
ncbi:T9SS type A sorting domain-containing protein [Chitinophaga ginsengisoli]|uniref:Putative secreted protein (Por secretion system target) n=1 Tax=Chitinophaga ginsengisoli TaxID=363837 RepID=A0A2P8G9L4_9BACT|nr:T9SS type A sorting domain-containing protein [Chitinophaga ginsengisoli]PSL30664.1 putative secreted protein (Por secretion system target) [Chitinophaga ginsengisoli]